MSLIEPKTTWDRVPVTLQFSETVKMTETYGFAGSQGVTSLEGQRLVPRGRPSRTVFLFMHPTPTPACTCSAPAAATPRTTAP
jgi:hypothetical protein